MNHLSCSTMNVRFVSTWMSPEDCKEKRSDAYLILAVVPLIDVEKNYQQHRAPTFVEPLRSQDATIDSIIVFECIIHGEPTPHVVWERDGIELCQGESLSRSTSHHHLYRLTLRHVQLSDSGNYACRATNFAGEATSVADLRVYSNLPQHGKKIGGKDISGSREEKSEEGKTDRRHPIIVCRKLLMILVRLALWYIPMPRESSKATLPVSRVVSLVVCDECVARSSQEQMRCACLILDCLTIEIDGIGSSFFETSDSFLFFFCVLY